MRKMITAATMLLAFVTAKGQEQVDSSYANGYYRDRLAFFKQLPDLKKEIVFDMQPLMHRVIMSISFVRRTA